MTMEEYLLKFVLRRQKIGNNIIVSVIDDVSIGRTRQDNNYYFSHSVMYRSYILTIV